MLITAIEFLYLKDYVFRFGLDSICPTYEEFSAMLGVNPSVAAAFP